MSSRRARTRKSTGTKNMGTQPQHRLNPVMLGLWLAVANTLLFVVLTKLFFLSLWISTVAWYPLLFHPILFTLFWLWFSQLIVHKYQRVSLHNALMIAKIGVLPLMTMLFGALFLLTILVGMQNEAVSTGLLQAFIPNAAVSLSFLLFMVHYVVVLSSGSILLCICVVVFGVRHRFPHSFMRFAGTRQD